MTDKRVVVPTEMLTAAWQSVAAKMKEYVNEGRSERVPELHVARIALEAALSYQREYPPVPTEKQVEEMVVRVNYLTAIDPEHNHGITRAIRMEWPRRMYDAPAEPKGIDDLLAESQAHMTISSDTLNKAIREAYARGLKERP